MAMNNNTAGVVGTTNQIVTSAAGEFVRDKRGSTAIEYSLIVGLIFLAIVASVKTLGGTNSDQYQDISDTLENS